MRDDSYYVKKQIVLYYKEMCPKRSVRVKKHVLFSYFLYNLIYLGTGVADDVTLESMCSYIYFRAVQANESTC